MASALNSPARKKLRDTTRDRLIDALLGGGLTKPSNPTATASSHPCFTGQLIGDPPPTLHATHVDRSTPPGRSCPPSHRSYRASRRGVLLIPMAVERRRAA